MTKACPERHVVKSEFGSGGDVHWLLHLTVPVAQAQTSVDKHCVWSL